MQFRQQRGPIKPLVVPYLGYGTASEIYMKGRVLADNGITVAQDKDPFYINVQNMYKRYIRRAIPNALVRASFNDQQHEMLTDLNGYFHLHLSFDPPHTFQGDWFDIEFELVRFPGQLPQSEPSPKTKQKFLIPCSDAQFGVISDIDDTVLRTDILNVFRMISNTFFYNALTRLPFKGVSAFYDALQSGTVNGASNPIYYVSNSTWALYDVIADFFVARGIPNGPLFLSEMGVLHTASNRNYKIGVIQRLLDLYPQMPFILIGDSGQRDPETYLEVVQNNPGRIKTIYIRDVTGRRRAAQIKLVIAQVKALGGEMLFMDDTGIASEHALQRGYIMPHTVPAIEEERKKDEQPPILNPAS